MNVPLSASLRLVCAVAVALQLAFPPWRGAADVTTTKRPDLTLSDLTLLSRGIPIDTTPIVRHTVVHWSLPARAFWNRPIIQEHAWLGDTLAASLAGGFRSLNASARPEQVSAPVLGRLAEARFERREALMAGANVPPFLRGDDLWSDTIVGKAYTVGRRMTIDFELDIARVLLQVGLTLALYVALAAAIQMIQAVRAARGDSRPAA